MNNLNGTWKKIIVCGIIGLVLGLIVALSSASGVGVFLKILIIFPIMPIGLNIFYWGWIKTHGLLRKLNLFLVMSIGKWIVFYVVLFFLSYFVGFVAFPLAVVRAVKNEE